MRILGLCGEFRWDLERLGKEGEMTVTGRVTVSEGIEGFWGDINGREYVV